MRVLPVSPADMRDIYGVLTALESAAAETLARKQPDRDANCSPLVDATRDMDARAQGRRPRRAGRRLTSASTSDWSSSRATAR